MDTTIDRERGIEEIGEVFEQISRKGKTAYTQILTLVCPRCGSRLTYTPIGASWAIKCERGGCVNLSSRGI